VLFAKGAVALENDKGFTALCLIQAHSILAKREKLVDAKRPFEHHRLDRAFDKRLDLSPHNQRIQQKLGCERSADPVAQKFVGKAPVRHSAC